MLQRFGLTYAIIAIAQNTLDQLIGCKLRNIVNFPMTGKTELGRKPSVRWGARKIDIDILLIDGSVLL